MADKDKKESSQAEDTSTKQAVQLLTSILADVKKQVDRESASSSSINIPGRTSSFNEDVAQAIAIFEEIEDALSLASGVISVSPNSGPNAGNTSVVIAGRNLLPGAEVKFGNDTATEVAVESSRKLTAKTPARGSAGSVDVVVTTAAGSATLTNGYTYTG